MDIDKASFDIECPRCKFLAEVRLRDARLRDVLICRGCKSNIQLDDNMNECRKARRQIQEAIDKLGQALKGFNASIKF